VPHSIFYTAKDWRLASLRKSLARALNRISNFFPTPEFGVFALHHTGGEREIESTNQFSFVAVFFISGAYQRYLRTSANGGELKETIDYGAYRRTSHRI
jgi:hypothetical protein